jgi:ComF family protein
MRFEIYNSTKQFLQGLSSIAFPNVCLCCGLETTEQERNICSFCKEERFEAANPRQLSSSSGIILPEGVVLQHALWIFDKGGLLQQLMHYLKYEHLTVIGDELGRMLARSLQKHSAIADVLEDRDRLLLVPVPLHYLKFRKRGFNQAFMIARGMQNILEVPICSLKSVVRKRNTRSQTGFTLEKRLSNIKDAFRVRTPGMFRDHNLIIVDDVFTTGSTTFELAGQLKQAGCAEIVIATVAQA